MHEIKIIDEEKLNITIDIDGKKLRFSRRGNPAAVYSATMISDDLEHLLEATASGQPLHEVSFHLAGTNVIRLIDAFCLDDALRSWQNYAERTIVADCIVREILYQYLGFTISSHLQGSPFCIAAKKIGAQCRHEKISQIYHDGHYFDSNNSKTFLSQKARSARSIQRQEAFEGNGIRVEFLSQDGLLCSFLVNGVTVSFPLSRTGYSLTPKKLYSIIVEIRDDIQTKNFTRFENLTKKVGGKTILYIILALYKEEATEFLIAAFQSSYQLHRQIPSPYKMIKTLFHCSPGNLSGVDELLASLELLLPEAEQYLLDTNYAEIESDKDMWVLYHPRPGSIIQCTITFNFGTPLDQELRDYLRAAAKSWIRSSVSVAQFLQTKWSNIRIALMALEKIGIDINSITNISIADCLNLQSYFAQSSSLKIKTQRNSLLEMKAFYQYAADQYGLVEKNPFEYIHLPKLGDSKHTAPITNEALSAIEDRISQLPMCIRLAFCVAVHTGARASSICSFTTNSLVNEDGVYYLIVYHNKTFITHTAQNKPTTTKHNIDQDLAYALLDYISKTDDLRRQFNEPFIFIYQSANLRNGTRRKPTVLTSNSFSYQINTLVKDVPLFHTDGTPVRCNFKSIRAEVGQAMFAKGYSADDVARMLGNTPKIAATHYNTMEAREEAEFYNRHYNAAFASAREQIEKRHNTLANMIRFPNRPSRSVTYGYCESDTSEHCNKNDCNNCRQRIVCREERQSKKEECL